jgi:hypothetical protein
MIDTSFETQELDLLGSMEHETLDLKCIKVVKDYLKQQVITKCKGRNEKECTHLQYKKKTFPRKLEELMI